MIKDLRFKNKKKNTGFTLIETMVAITILLTAIVGPMEIASKALFSAFYARDQITAYYLAQEGIEYFRHVRDTYYLNPANSGAVNWPNASGNDFSSCISDQSTTFGCRADVKTQSITKYSSQAEASTTLSYNSDSGLYSYDAIGGNVQPSKYTRVIIASQDVTNPDAMLITSTISWTGSYLSGGTKTFTLKETLYKWQTK